MRLLGLASVTALGFATITTCLSPPARATGLQWGRAPAGLPDLGPVGNGRRLYVEFNCNMCHGARAGGQTGPSIQNADSGDVSEAVRNGVPEAGMPSYGKYVNSKNLFDIAAYLHSIGGAKEPMWWDWWLPHPKI